MNVDPACSAELEGVYPAGLRIILTPSTPMAGETGFTGSQLLAAGPIEGEEAAHALDGLRRRGINVVAPGRVDRPQTAFQAMDVFCLPSYREGLPNVVLEASSCGFPVVATRVTGKIDLIENGVTGLLVPPRSAEDLADAFIDLIDNAR